MVAATTNFNVDQGADFTTTIDILNNDGTPINIAGYQFAGVVRKTYYTSNTVANLVMTITDAANGNLSVSLPGNVSSNIEQGRYGYSVRMTTTANVPTMILKGTITILPSDLQVQPITYIP